VSKHLTVKIESLAAATENQLTSSRANLVEFFKTIFSTEDHHEAQLHPLFRDSERPLLKKLRRHLKLFELCIRNFEVTYIAMIRELQEKTFQLNIDCDQERSIIMKRREVAENRNKVPTTKVIENQMFDLDGNILVTNCSSVNQSGILNTMLLQSHGLCAPAGTIDTQTR
jgi:hypothetical protein